MKKRIVSLLIVLALCLMLLPTALAADETVHQPTEEPEPAPIHTAIASVDDLLTFAKEVNEGRYDKHKGAVVTLERDLDMTGEEWTSIGCADENADVAHYFCGTFYGNGHVISNLDFSKEYGAIEYAPVGFFGYIENATVTGLTVQGSITATEARAYNAFGAIAGLAAGCQITDCVSDMTINNNGNFLYGFIGLCGYAEDTVIDHCRSKGRFTITGDMGSLSAGGIVGYIAGSSEVSFCENTTNMTINAPHVGGLVGSLSSGAKLSNSYSTGSMTPVGRPIWNMGGLVGTVYGADGITNCYFAGSIDLSQYEGKAPYTRLGSIIGKISSGAPTFANNYYAETESVPACGGSIEAGTAKTAAEMTTEDFYKEITAGGGQYRYEESRTPLLPNMQYEVTFVVTPEELSDVTIKIDGQEVEKTVRLEAGTYALEVTADQYETVKKDITISADVATHTQTIELQRVQPVYPTYPTTPTKPEKSPFADVSVDDAFYDAVKWAAEKGIALGLGGNFEPNAVCTRAQVVTFLWRAAGSPEPKGESGFTDVPAGSYYAKAVAWAVENGITNGTGGGKFSPDAVCSRAQGVTLLCRALGGQAKGAASFSDVPAGSYYEGAVAWAAETGVTTGVTSDLFAPANACTRAQMIVFLYCTYQN